MKQLRTVNIVLAALCITALGAMTLTAAPLLQEHFSLQPGESIAVEVSCAECPACPTCVPTRTSTPSPTPVPPTPTNTPVPPTVTPTQEPTPTQQPGGRWVMNPETERGFAWVHGPSVDLYGIGSRMFLFSSIPDMCAAMNPAAIKLPHIRFHHGHEVLEQPDVDPSGFPIEDITDAMLLKAGGQPVRWDPVWMHNPEEGTWAFDLGSEEYLDLWVSYIEGLTDEPGCENLWVGVDNFGFNTGWYAPRPAGTRAIRRTTTSSLTTACTSSSR